MSGENYFRFCAICNDKITYQSLGAYKTGLYRNTKCFKCKNKLNGINRQTNFIDDNFFKTLGPVQAWVLGMLITDGNISDSHLISISQSGEEGLNRIKYIKEQLLFTGLIYIENPKRKDGSLYKTKYTLRFISEEISNILKQHLIVPRKTLITKFSPIIAKSNNKIIASYVRGCIEGDGCVSIETRKKSLRISLASTKEFAETLIKHTPTPMGVYVHKQCKNLVETVWSGKKAKDLVEWMDCDLNLYHGEKWNKAILHIK